MIINDKNGNPAAEVDGPFRFTVEGPKNPAFVAKQALLAFPANEVSWMVDEESFDAAVERCGDVDASGFMIDSWESIADLCRLGGFTIELVDGVFRAR